MKMKMDHTTVTRLDEDRIAHVQLSRSSKLNTMTSGFFKEIKSVFETLSRDDTVRVVIISAERDSRVFTAGLDLKEVDTFPKANEDAARQALQFLQTVQNLQHAFNAIESCRHPVIAAVSGLCIGGGIDLITACDIRLCSKDAVFTVKEIDVGLAADLGTLQRLPRIVGNDSWVREICLTGRSFSSQEALQFGLVSRVFESRELLFNSALQLAAEIASKPPVAIVGVKHVLNYSRDHSIADGLGYVGLWNSVMLNTPDTIQAAMSVISKNKNNGKYSKL